MELRDYQKNVIQRTRNHFANGSRRPLVVLPCGAGKTVCFADMAHKHIEKDPNNFVWFLVHRQELVDQTIETFTRFGIPMNNVFVGMVQTVTRNLTKFKTPSIIIFDEAHHAKAKTWYNIIDFYNNVPMIGLTATPIRMDGKPLGDVFDSLIIGEEADSLISQGYLSPYDYYAPPVKDMEFKMKGVDYDLDHFTAELLKSKIYGEITKYVDQNKKTIIYSPSIAFSKMLVEKIGATHFDGDTPKAERRQIVEDFKSGKIKLLSNVDLIGEGFDVPDCEVIILLRPTQSLSLYVQQATRGLRPQPGKRATIYDLVGNVYRHGMPTEKRDWSLSDPKKVRNPSGEPDVVVRRCEKCLLVYGGRDRICPHCEHDNGKTRAEIEQEEKAELEKIEAIEKKKERIEVGRARTLEELIQIGYKRGYKNPYYWAKMVFHSRKKI